MRCKGKAMGRAPVIWELCLISFPDIRVWRMLKPGRSLKTVGDATCRVTRG